MEPICEYTITPLIYCFLAGWCATLIVKENLTEDATFTIMAASGY